MSKNGAVGYFRVSTAEQANQEQPVFQPRRQKFNLLVDEQGGTPMGTMNASTRRPSGSCVPGLSSTSVSRIFVSTFSVGSSVLTSVSSTSTRTLRMFLSPMVRMGSGTVEEFETLSPLR